MQPEQHGRASLQVAPLDLVRNPSASAVNGPYQHANSSQSAQMTPPVTPSSSQEDLSPDAPPIFHNFLRAFYPFQPSHAATESSVTLPLEEGDVILVHSIHTNGWADGTLLISGARGWLPTNYCEAYEPDDLRALLKSLLNFWDLLRSTSVDDSELFRNQEFMKGIIAGVRFLLERTNCLNRESVIVQRNDGLRKCRKSLLAELSLLVKTAKRLQDSQRQISYPVEDVNDVVDEMILKAFRIVNKGVRFLDVLEEDRRARAPASVTVMATVQEESYVPPTPPADRLTFDEQRIDTTSEAGSRAFTDDTNASVAASDLSEAIHASQAHWNKRLSSLNQTSTTANRRASQGSISQNRSSATFAHRVSLAGPSPHSRPGYLISERLGRKHDRFLSHLGSFIGRLHWHSPSRMELSRSVSQSACSAGELLTVVDGVMAHCNVAPVALQSARAAFLERSHGLVFSTRDILVRAATQDADVITSYDTSILLASATDCVKAAGECVAKAKATIERIGDFEYDVEGSALDIDLSILDIVPHERSRTPSAAEPCPSEAVSAAESLQAADSYIPVRRESLIPLNSNTHNTFTSNAASTKSGSPTSSRPSSSKSATEDGSNSSAFATRPSLPPLPKLTTTLLPPDANNHSDMSARELDNHSARFDAVAASSAGSSTTYLSRDSEASMISQTSTRATTPEQSLAPRPKPSISDMSSASNTALADDADDVESRLLEKTFAHELMFNKEGQVTGGSLPALVERLTTHESTPDATFVSTFFLTFRLFCTPIKLAKTLVDRFDYVADAPHMAGPVRLRVYNAFKGWLESHWRDSTDRDALKVIMPFAEGKLAAVLPSAGRRLLELAMKVSGQGSLVPRFVSSIGKTNTAIGQYIPAETPLPPTAVSKHQQHLLNAFKAGTAAPTLLDFEPIELARQITLKQMGIFCSIMPEELLGSQWMKKGGVEAPNVKAMSSLSTDLSNLVADTILEHVEIKKRATIIKHWIKVAYQCLELHNYDGLMAIICSLNSSTINRLRKTWDAVSPKRKDLLRRLQQIVEPSQNNKVLRTRLHDHVPPCLPFLGMYLTDLTFVDIGNPATKQMSLGTEGADDGTGGLTVVNFDKHTRTAKIIGELQRFQIPYRLTELPDMQDWITSEISRVRQNDQGNVQVSYYRKSLLLEPREVRRDVEPPTPVATTGAVRGDLFGWMTRDRNHHNATPAQV
ncbi:Ras guanine nucleotide exchange factor [Cordyceps fumosorosea ARSEF 2679]|uniref:Ras guanine nucleotide exchange factor n=1 Tax=Cordyceps fumosorosea (strain ARSEF 2679) TaxID=1081104 RepID=A0A167P9Y7_CORFA|nr:Ras guanine nucleotide exchange factor [Cordyceps fumosorosea ARSEF 2679]OAA56442.1 Ras guanine nucleotide exchange factor [Cordyceps fumosorosea ARSEF 2679]